jgi:integrase/recombinase XerC
VATPKLIPRRDTSGPDPERLTKALRALAEEQDGHSIRDAAIMALMFVCGLRIGEVLTMRLRDCDLARQRLLIVSKGRLGCVPKRGQDGRLVDPSAQEPDREVLEGVPRPVWRMLRRWVAYVRKNRPDIRRDAPLWWAMMPKGYLYKRLGEEGIRRAIKRRLRQAGLRPCASHGMRHAAITKALDSSGGNLRLVQSFARHADLRQLQRYDDHRQGLFGQGAKLVAEGLK